MAKDTSISIRMDSLLKQQTESILEQFGLNMTAVVNMLFRQIVREREIPLSLSLDHHLSAIKDLDHAVAERMAGYTGRSAYDVADDMERIITEVEQGAKKILG